MAEGVPIFPACYPGRRPHIHVEVYPDQASITRATNAIATSQVALPEAVSKQVYATSGYEASVGNLSRLTLASDMVFGDDSAALQMGTVTGDVSREFAVSLTAGVDTRTVPSVGRPGRPGGRPPMPGASGS